MRCLRLRERKGEWILSLDADEQVLPELAAEIKETIRTGNREDGYLIPMKFYFFGHWMRHGGLYPKPHLRLFRKGKGLFDKISGLIEQARRKVATTINQEMVLLYWNIGKTVKEEIIKSDRAEYGKKIVNSVSSLSCVHISPFQI